MDRRRLGELMLLLATVVGGASIATTWTTSGRRDRNGVTTLESLDRLDVLDPPWNTLLVIVTASIPLFLAASAAGFALGRRVPAAAGAAAAGTVLGAWALVVIRSPVRAVPGPELALLATFALVVTVWCAPRAHRQQE